MKSGSGSPVDALIARYRETKAKLDAACINSDTAELGREPNAQEQARFNQASEAESDAMWKVLSAKPSTPTEAKARAEFVRWATSKNMLAEDTFAAMEREAMRAA